MPRGLRCSGSSGSSKPQHLHAYCPDRGCVARYTPPGRATCGYLQVVSRLPLIGVNRLIHCISAGTRVALSPMRENECERQALIATVVVMSALFWSAAAVTVRARGAPPASSRHAATLAEIGAHPQSTIVYDRQNRPVFTFYVEQRMDVPLDRVSPHMIDALLAVEDRRFYSHHGLDPVRIVKAAWRNWQRRPHRRGGQHHHAAARAARAADADAHLRRARSARVVASPCGSKSATPSRKSSTRYLNAVYFGDGYYGVEAASRGYFGKPASDLAAARSGAARGAGALAVRLFAEQRPAARARAPQSGAAADARHRAASAEAEYRTSVDPAAARPPADGGLVAASSTCGGYFQEEVRRQLVARFGGEQVLQGRPARLHRLRPRDAVRGREGDRRRASRRSRKARQGGARPRGQSRRARPGHRAKCARSSADATSARPATIRATQARRQPGSAFKPIIYRRGARARDGARVGPAPPRRADHDRQRAVAAERRARAARLFAARGAEDLEQPRRRAAAAAGRLQPGRRTTRSASASNRSCPPSPSLALGTGGVTLLELTSAYGVFANQGCASTPHLILRVEDRDGRVDLGRRAVDAHQAVTPTTAFLMSQHARRRDHVAGPAPARAAGFKLPAAGKTGTTDNYTDAWFIGYTPHLVDRRLVRHRHSPRRS